MAATHFSGPLQSGTLISGEVGGPNQGNVVLSQYVTITQNSTNAVTSSFLLPANSRIVGFNIDVLTAFDSATSATLTIGTAAAGTQYISGVNAKTAGRAAPTITAAQLLAASNIGTTNLTVFATVTPVGATTAGSVLVTCTYIQV